MHHLDAHVIIHRYTKLKESPSDIAADVGCAPDAIYRLLAKHDVPRNHQRGSTATPDHIVKKIVSLARQGAKMSHLARDFNLSKKTVYNILDRNGIDIRQ